ncbi:MULTISPECIES: hypothetical protein [unclassified Rhodococcus (in: high G+C Gram-positive bacteria)]|uniref:hypothetical protein n=1 Tax=unclassified Rhodococcus (in: high G+C Gram-positive bacteria) TaxID=192944 RepID=UPI000B9BDA3D|nr:MULTISPECIES: hypothetical protein [unclassified Rhodococcus (in: high G+C Gram-positive bacteria)]OZE35655.1 hypothetical protein CH259_16660 [Rhodococcus sp. 05-2254-4]OZE48084.1 hypothetical protein CH261_09255 [Rhodococcus sp. 05-2254-3]OZE49295.1 hypothetical protein CH283_17040 [Rhodococcus sp. 05-2254-2]
MNAGDTVTVDILPTLPVGAVIRTDTAQVAVKAFMGDDEGPEEWFETGDPTPLRPDELDGYPITILWLP